MRWLGVLVQGAVLATASVAFSQGAPAGSPGLQVAAGPAAQKKPHGKIEATWWGHAAWVIKTPAGTTIAIDPWFQNPSAPKTAKWPDAVDVILVTHAHSDHVGNAVELAKKTGAVVVGSYELLGLLNPAKASGANPGGTIRIKDVAIHLVEAVHSSGFGDKPKSVQYGGAPVGFVIDVQNGPTIYHAGDTDVFSSMELIAKRYHPDVAMLPIGGHFTMDPAGAALAAKLLHVKTVAPMHYGTFPMLSGTPDELKEELRKNHVHSNVVRLAPGEHTSL